MKASVIPAQITTVEDRIAANLNFTQIILLSVPLFMTAVIFFLLPPAGSFSTYKIIIATILSSLSSTLAIRVNNKLLLDHIKLRAKYLYRPHIYVYRQQQFMPSSEKYESWQPYFTKISSSNVVDVSSSPRNRALSQRLLSGGQYNVAFKAKSGGLVVKVNSVQ